MAWLIDAVTLLAESFGEPLTAQRLEIYARELVDLDPAALMSAFTRARRELKFFPKIAELRELAGASTEDALKIEADAAWDFANRYLEQHGVVKYDLDNRPALPPQIDYALRSIGGLWALNQMTSKSRPFMHKDFCEAYKRARTAELLMPQLVEKFCTRKLPGEVKELAAAQTPSEKFSEAKPTQVRPFPAKSTLTPLTEPQIRDRRKLLRQQAGRLRSADISSPQVQARKQSQEILGPVNLGT